MAEKDKNKVSTTLTKGSQYLVSSLSTRDDLLKTSGYFKGYVTLGRGHALRIELDSSHDDKEGEVRVIPCHMVTSLDIIKEEESEEEETDSSSSYFG